MGLSNNQVCIFTSYSSSVGSGHLRRCINLGNFLESKGYSITLVTKITDIDEKNNIPDSFISLKTNSFKKNKLFQKIDNTSYNYFITDLLIHDLTEFLWVREMKTYVVSILSFKSDFYSKIFDLAFFPSVGNPNLIIDNNRNIFTGKKCILLKQSLEKGDFKINNYVKSVLMFFGGTDPYNITNTVINDLKHTNHNLKFNVLAETDLSYPDNFIFKGQVKNFYNELMNNDIAIINGGISRYECIYIGIPTIAVSIHKNQFNITKQISDMGAMINLGIHNELRNNSVSETLTRLVKNKEERISLNTNCKNILDDINENYNFILKKILHEKNK